MPELLTPDLIELREAGERFATDVLLPTDLALERGETDPAAARQEVISAAKAAGFFAMTQPRQYGGSEASVLALTALRDTLAGFNPGLLGATFGPGPGVLAGCVLAFARALGEFGATAMLAGDVPGETRTVALAVYAFYEQPGSEGAAHVLVGISVALCLLALIGYERLTAAQQRRLTDRDA